MRIHAALDNLAEVKGRLAPLYPRFYRRFCDLPVAHRLPDADMQV